MARQRAQGRRQMAQASKKRAIETPVIPDRLYFKIGDVAELCGVANSVLRFWETQFPQLKPNKSGTGQRLYRRRDVELALEIKRLVHLEGFTIAGARQALDGGARRPAPQAVAPAVQAQPVGENAKTSLTQVKTELRAIMDMLATPQAVVRRERVRVMKPRTEMGNLFGV
jgi:DNA-binding transcriptional MerR regulator